ncbi:DUF58 domain-containing protein [Nitratifractor sp.]
MKRFGSTLLLRARKAILLPRFGRRASLFAGEGTEFREMREYTGEEDVRHLNFQAFARTGKALVNLYDQERRLRLRVVYLHSASMALGPASKREMAASLLEVLGALARESGDEFAVTFFADRPRPALAPCASLRGAGDFARQIAALPPAEGGIDWGALTGWIDRLREPEYILLMGDFWDFDVCAPLKGRHTLRAAVLRDRREYRLPRGEFVAEDLIGSERFGVRVDGAAVRRYREALERYDRESEERLRRAGIGWERFWSGEDPIPPLARLLGRE